MCGIIGYIGKQEAVPILLEGLRRLEYRGYDSAGLAVLGKKVKCAKAVGKVKALEDKIKRQKLSGFLGIAHTRWATHGAPGEKNAHPHSDCRGNLWLAHNGIIENYQKLKKSLQAKGHKFKSETDTEVLVHLIEEEQSKRGGLTLEEATRRALKKVIGTYGLAVISAKEPQKIVVARQSSPLLIGVGENEYLVASDACAVITRTNQVIYLDDGEIGVIEPSGVKIINLDKEPIKKSNHIIDWDLSRAQKDGFDHFTLKEIFEQPQAIANSLRGRLISEDGLAKLGGLQDVEEKLRDIERLVVVGCGTAYYSGLIGEYMLEEYAGVPTEVEYASEFRYRKPVLDKTSALLCVSQSGETADSLAALQEARRKGILTLGFVNAVGSTIARVTDAGVYNHIGPEIGVASTKAFSSQICLFALLTLFLGRQRNLSLVMGQRIARELQNMPVLVKKVLRQDKVIQKIARKYFKAKDFFFLGRKYNFPLALEGALKLKEISYIHAEGYGAGEMKHGPIAMIDKNFPTLAIAPKDSVYEKMAANIEEIKARGGPVIALTTERNNALNKLADDVIFLPKTLEMLTPILAVVPLQLLAYHCAILKNRDVDKPRNLAKSVTVE
ncbi:MAG: glutamine--fructose-6-phosphate transaminase (isomerizing) [Candidatus Portnoybacteria bacterium CG02_land_8_20_14_3_00_45_8]|uniref:Glutamine--fructose-6-phosphate aminotransferase [isomerizing] n=1 Tax=Candidatus Portnoybacteria bacterium CG02_land_8_20_14_3_00_45_8 TaxID=1974807 RepID=A0A2M7D6G8_9BACT|nr:MAG: glutamine--fructose-6-phosphate transaminase (isomerizing) [Candidatus Portnoybacteria bacterium CG02_land_8_20_14_3_00_45_8]